MGRNDGPLSASAKLGLEIEKLEAAIARVREIPMLMTHDEMSLIAMREVIERAIQGDDYESPTYQRCMPRDQ